MNHARTLLFAGIFVALLTGCASRKQIFDLSDQTTAVQNNLSSMRSEQQRMSRTLDSLTTDLHSFTAQSQFGSSALEEKVQALAARLDDIITRMDRSLAPLEEFLRSQTASDTSGAKSGSMGVDYYDAAVRDLGLGNYDLAEVGFLQYLEINPNSELSDDARYGLGESYYARKRYDEAIEEYRRVVDMNPDGTKAPAAMLKIGLAFRADEDLSAARKTWRELIEQYPRSEEAQVAKQRLDELKSR